MQGLVYIFMGVCGVALGAVAYFLAGFTPIESSLLALLVIVAGALIEERAARKRAFSRLERGVEEMARLLATDAKAGQVLSERVNALANLDLGPRIEVIEADMSVLGTVVRQVAEAVSELESARPTVAGPSDASSGGDAPLPVRQPDIALADVRRAIEEGRMVFSVQPILTLPQRRLHAYDLVPLLAIGDRLVEPPHYLPVPTVDGSVVLRRIDFLRVEEAVRIVRRARLGGETVRVMVDLTPATLADRASLDPLLSMLGANKAINPDLGFVLDYADWAALGHAEADALAAIAAQGVGLALRNATTLRLDFAALAEKGVRAISVSGRAFLRNPATLTDFHPSDITDYIKRFGINLIVSGLEAEPEILALLDDGVKLAQGDPLGPLAPLREDLRADTDDRLRRTATR